MHSSAGTAVSASRQDASPHRVTFVGATDKGMQRDQNEDRFGLFPEIGLAVVADGMGGEAAGEVAAGMAVEFICEALADGDVTWPLTGGPQGRGELAMLVAAVERANYCIHGASAKLPSWSGMGTTVAAVLARGPRAAIAHVGDSRIYRLRNHQLELLSEDHSLFNEWVRAGLADPDHPEAFPHPNVITRALGPGPTVQVDVRLVEVMSGDTFLLSSDGLHGVVNQRELAAILLSYRNPYEAVERLVGRANELGGPDNITAVLVGIA